MRNIVVRDMRSADLTLLKAPERIRHFFMKNGTRGPALTGYVFDGDEEQGCMTVLFSCGLQELHEGVAEAWAILSPAAGTYGNVGRTVKALLQQGFEHFHRIHATCVAGNRKAARFLEYLGFNREGWLAQYGPDRHDHILYAIVRHASVGEGQPCP